MKTIALRLTAITIVALILALPLLDVAQAASPAPDCYPTNLPSYPEYNQPGVKENWAKLTNLSQNVCRIDGRPPRQNECKFTYQLGIPEGAFGKGAENSWLCWYGEPPSHDPRLLDVTSGIAGQLKFSNLFTALNQLLGNQWIIQLNVGTTMPAPDCYRTSLSSYPEYNQPGVKENWAKLTNLSQDVCRIDGRPPRQNECKFTYQLGIPEGAFGKGAENSWLCWYGDPK